MQDRVGQRLKKLRETKGYAQMKLEVEAQLSLGTISRIENEVSIPMLSTLLKISDSMKLNNQETIYLILGWAGRPSHKKEVLDQ